MITPTHTPFSDIDDDTVANILDQAFQFKLRNEGRLVIAKASGKVIDDPIIRRRFAQQVTIMRRDLGLNVIVVHGAGGQITAALKAAGFESEFKDGARITRAAHVETIATAMWQSQKILCQTFDEVSGGRINALGLSGSNANLITAKALDAKGDNFTGTPIDVNEALLRTLLADGITVPVVSTMCTALDTSHGVHELNVNADDVGALLSIRLKANRLFMCSDNPGVMDKNGNLIRQIITSQMADLIGDGTITGGMIKKIEAACTTANAMGDNGAVVIMDENFLVELLTERGRGTMVRKSPQVLTT